MRDNPHTTFLAHDCIPSKTKVELSVRKRPMLKCSAISIGLQRGRPIKCITALVSLKTFIQFFENVECIANDIFNLLGHE